MLRRITLFVVTMSVSVFAISGNYEDHISHFDKKIAEKLDSKFAKMLEEEFGSVGSK